jgi:hypothetical protein
MKHVRILKSKLFVALMIFAMIFLSGLYIFQVNAEISDRYLVDNYAKKSSELSRENKVLQVALAKASSLDSLALQVEPLNFQKIDKINYIKVLSTQAVAK